MSVLKAAFQLVSLAGGAKLSILIFHRVLPEPDPIFPDDPDARQFDRILGWIASWFNVLPLDVAVDALKRGNLPTHAMAITFDDGYADNRTVALPILERHGLSATFFIATGYLDGGRMWNDTIIEGIRGSQAKTLDLGNIQGSENGGMNLLPISTVVEKRTAIQTILGNIKHLSPEDREAASRAIATRCGTMLPDDLMMTTEQVKEMRHAGMLIGAHTVSHPILAKLGVAGARREISESKQTLERVLGEEISLFAYPNGKPDSDFQIKDSDIVRDLGFKMAVTTAWGVADKDSDMMHLPRFTPWGRTKISFGAQLLGNMVQNEKFRSSQTASS